MNKKYSLKLYLSRKSHSQKHKCFCLNTTEELVRKITYALDIGFKKIVIEDTTFIDDKE